MGGKAGGIIGIVLGAILVVTGIGTFAGIMLIAGGIMSLAFQPKTPDQEAARSQELSISTASIGNPVPVVFGTVRITPNFLHYTTDSFRTVEVKGEVQGGKGGESPPPATVGYDYFLQWEYALCMGPIDAVGQVMAMPGEVAMNAETMNLFSGDYVELTLSAENQGGVARVYKGSYTQTRIASGDQYQADTGMNYRGVCWALMGVGTDGFYMGTMPQPNTYQFHVRRLPKPIRDDLSSVNMTTRGSYVVAHPCYWAANPAAIIYEILTNKDWGRGLSSDIIHEQSFIDCSDFFARHNLGMNFKIEGQENVGDLLEGIRRHVKTVLTWDGEYYKLRCLMDPDQTHEFIQTLRSDEIGDFKVTRPSWDGVTNELRAEFQSEERAYRTDMGHVQNIAARDIMGGWTTSDRYQLSAFATPEVVQQQLGRILGEVSYPYMTAQWEMNRYKSMIEVGDVVRVIWAEFDESQVVTSYWMVLQIEDGASDDENIKITAVEDFILGPVAGEETDVTLPDYQAWEWIVPPDATETNLHVPPAAPAEAILPITVFELPPQATGGNDARTLVIGEKVHGLWTGTQGMWSKDGTGFTIWGVASEFAVTGELVDAMPGDVYFDRTPGYEMTMTDPAKMAALLGVTLVDTPEDDLEVLVQARQHFLLIDDEVMQVGYIEQVDSTTVRLRNIVRGVYGSKVASHTATTKVFYTATKAFGFGSNDLPQDSALYFRGYPVGLWGAVYAYGANVQTPSGTWRGRGRRPMAPQPILIEDDQPSAGNMRITVRPVWAQKGAGVQPFYEAAGAPINNLDGLGFAVHQFDNTTTQLSSFPDNVHVVTYTPDALDDTSAGVAVLVVGKRDGVAVVRVHQTFNGRVSPDYAHFLI